MKPELLKPVGLDLKPLDPGDGSLKPELLDPIFGELKPGGPHYPRLDDIRGF